MENASMRARMSEDLKQHFRDKSQCLVHVLTNSLRQKKKKNAKGTGAHLSVVQLSVHVNLPLGDVSCQIRNWMGDVCETKRQIVNDHLPEITTCTLHINAAVEMNHKSAKSIKSISVINTCRQLKNYI